MIRITMQIMKNSFAQNFILQKFLFPIAAMNVYEEEKN